MFFSTGLSCVRSKVEDILKIRKTKINFNNTHIVNDIKILLLLFCVVNIDDDKYRLCNYGFVMVNRRVCGRDQKCDLNGSENTFDTVFKCSNL